MGREREQGLVCKTRLFKKIKKIDGAGLGRRYNVGNTCCTIMRV